MATIQKIIPCLWFDSQAEQAAAFYASIFDNSRVGRITRYSEEGQEVHGRRPGTVMTVSFELDGVSFTALNGGPHFKFSEAVSLQVMCETQQEIDRLWNQLGSGGDESAQRCGWLKDKFGLSWQIVPAILPDLLSEREPMKAQRTMSALLKMKKLDIGALKRAHAG
jgi:predicted 3-demethylubiquinone-9 3-methyltransferase (glyoxalase superfamily)